VSDSSTLRARRWLITAVILPAVLFRAAIPAGFMPAFDAQGRVSLQICPGLAGEPVAHGAATDPHAHHHHDNHGKGDAAHGAHSGVCPFALSAGPALAGSFLSATMAAPLSTQVAGEPPSARTVASIERAQLARGPPAPHWI
jgi:hypothetical protein